MDEVIFILFFLKSNCLLEPIQEYEKWEERRLEGGREKVGRWKRMRSASDVSCEYIYIDKLIFCIYI